MVKIPKFLGLGAALLAAVVGRVWTGDSKVAKDS